MKKISNCNPSPTGRNKLLLIMRLSCIIMLVGLLSVNATNYSQSMKFSISMQNSKVSEVLKAIENQSDFYFFFNNEELDGDQVVDVEAKDETISEVLGQILEDDNLDFEIVDRYVVIAKKDKLRQMVGQLNQRTVSGVVRDSNGETIPGVAVKEKGTNNGVITDESGRFTIKVMSEESVLLFSFVGMRSQIVTVGNQKELNIVMVEDLSALEEVVVVGYGVQKKDDLTGAAEVISEEDFNVGITSSPEQLMQGRVAGVQIMQNGGEPGAGITVRVRGSNSIRSNNSPLYVIDGIPMDNNTDVTPGGAGVNGINSVAAKNPLNFLSADDIESINVLKDASATAIYGSRGANGVILITTKKGSVGEKTSVTYSGYTAISYLPEKYDVMSASDFKTQAAKIGVADYDKGAETDWQDEIFRTALTHNHTISLSGGTSKSAYRASLNYMNQEGIVDRTGQEKLSGRLNTTLNAIEDRLKVDFSMNFVQMKDLRGPYGEGGGFEGDIFLQSIRLNPTMLVKNADGTYYQPAASEDLRNPVAMLNLFDDETRSHRVLTNLTASLKIIEGLNYKVNLGYDYSEAKREISYNKELLIVNVQNQGQANVNTRNVKNYLVENYINYDKTFNKIHKLNLLAGVSYQNFSNEILEVGVRDFSTDNVDYVNNLRLGSNVYSTPNTYKEENELQSFFARINYNLMDRYLVTANFRRDGSTKFGENNKYANFPSLAFAWRLSEEAFIKEIDIIDNLKVRVGWGMTGNQEIPNRISLASVGTDSNAKGYYNGKWVSGLTYNRTPNPEIKWETTSQINFGIDFSILKGRLSGNIDIFSKETTDLLLQIPSKSPAPNSLQWTNADCKIINKGIELGLSAAIIKQKDFSWDVDFNISHLQNDVEDLPVSSITTGNASGPGFSGTRVQVITNGKPMHTFYGNVFEGYDNSGVPIYKKDAEGNEALEYLGDPNPDISLGLNNTIRYKNFDFSVYMYGLFGHQIYNNTANIIESKASFSKGFNTSMDMANSKEDKSTAVRFSDKYIEDAGFVRLANVSIGYTIKTNFTPYINSLRIYASGQNLMLFTDYSGFDPEANTSVAENDVPSRGVDYTSYPKARTFMFGVKVNF